MFRFWMSIIGHAHNSELSDRELARVDASSPSSERSVSEAESARRGRRATFWEVD